MSSKVNSRNLMKFSKLNINLEFINKKFSSKSSLTNRLVENLYWKVYNLSLEELKS